MTNHPFPPTADSEGSLSSRRRSTRIDYITPIFLHGRDAAGQSYRELTQTVVVNLHGCKLRTSYRVLVGMLVTLECPKSGLSGKGVCVRVWDPPAGVAGHEIAVQLVKPQNLWGVPNPPADWETVAKNMVQGRVAQGERPSRPLAPPTPSPAPTPVPVIAPPPPSPPPPLSPKPVVPTRPPVITPFIEQRLAELEQRSQQLVDSVLDILRSQAEELTRVNLEVFRQQIEALMDDAEQRLRKGTQQSYEEAASSLIGLRTDLMEQIASRSAQLIRASEDSLRARLREMLSAQARGSAPTKPPDAPPNK